ncbi:adhesion G-protein coupled receptor G5 [Oryzias melastigma]|uniref:adhesion G-protein coupled receptor G5 n=1 Tax=Oryzias melastigma TaxID=30732 RepID=UPI00168CDCB2|nr:adhesion G-protein coupled receptor G5 [Oryzias melastigma]
MFSMFQTSFLLTEIETSSVFLFHQQKLQNMMKFWIIVGVMLPVFTLNKAMASTSCDKASFVESCKTQNFTTHNISSVCKKENFPNQNFTGGLKNLNFTRASKTKPVPPTGNNEDSMDKCCSYMWFLCCNASIPNLLHNGSVNDSSINDTEFQTCRNNSDELQKFAKEMLVKIFCPACEIERSINLSLPQIACFVECIIQRWPLGEADISKDLFDIEELLQIVMVEATEVLSKNSYVALLYKHTGDFSGVEFHANESQISIGVRHNYTKMSFWLPKELGLSSNETLVFLTLQLPNQTADNSSTDLFERRLFGLSVSKRRVSGLQETANFTISFTPELNKIPQCVFLDYSTKNFSSEGCRTEWESGQNSVRCFCDHFTYFGVLLVSPSLSPEDVKILTYITSIGCGISLFALVLTAFLLFTNRELQTEDSKKIHANLVIALILLNLHLIPSEVAAESSSPGLCLYMALALHYSLLATFCWMALEGFHLFRLMVKVFNIYIDRYMLKISVVGWGVPAVIVSVLLSINKDFYGRYTFMDSSNSSSTAICYITDEEVKGVTTVGVFALMFLFVMAMFLVTVRQIMPNCCQKQFKQKDWRGLKQNMCTVLVLITLLGITWGLIFFSFGQLTTPGLYLFCVVNSLQGFFIFLYFVISLRKTEGIQTSSSERPSTKKSNHQNP